LRTPRKPSTTPVRARLRSPAWRTPSPAETRTATTIEPTGRHAKIHPLSSSETMDIERVNAIGTLLADLTARTAALRGYL
jgi:hypothetical protein